MSHHVIQLLSVESLMLCGFVIRTSEAKLNNFCRIEPTLCSLEVSFDTNVARDVMTEKTGTAARLVYQLFVALSNKNKNKNVTGAATSRPSATTSTKLEAISSVLYKEASNFTADSRLDSIFY